MAVLDELRSQWRNPGDVLSLLLLIGGNTVQQAIAQLFGVYVQPSPSLPRFYVTPVAFSFGWVAYAFGSLSSIIGDNQLMPAVPDAPAVVVNCSNGIIRANQSWLLSRILRDRELAVESNPGPEAAVLSDREILEQAGLMGHPPIRVSLRIDIFKLGCTDEMPLEIDRVWVLGWCTIATQLAISIIPWALYGNWAIFAVTGAGTIFALVTAGLRQWNLEKWPGRRLNPTTPQPDCSLSHDQTPNEHPSSPPAKCGCHRSPTKPKTKTVCLTKGNGHRYAMVMIGSGTAWDLETLATATSDSLPETPWLLGILALCWMSLLITVSGIESNTWFLVLIGGLGMVQNVYAASAPRSPQSMGLPLEAFSYRPTVIGSSTCEEKYWKVADDESVSEVLAGEDDDGFEAWNSPLETVGVRGAMRELEKVIPGAGNALMPVYFPGTASFVRERYRDAREAKFWRWAMNGRRTART